VNRIPSARSRRRAAFAARRRLRMHARWSPEEAQVVLVARGRSPASSAAPPRENGDYRAAVPAPSCETLLPD
jgi:hypothetical protein